MSENASGSVAATTTEQSQVLPAKRPRWSRERKQKNQIAKAKDPQQSNKPPETGAQDTKKKATKRDKVVKAPPLTPLEQLLECAHAAQHTKSVRMSDIHDIGSLSPSDLIPVRTACQPMRESPSFHLDNTFMTRPSITVQPLLVLDLNGILCHRIRIKSQQQQQQQHHHPQTIRYRQAISNIANTPIVPRIHLMSFLQYLDSYFTLAIWTSARAKTAKQLVEWLVPTSIKDKLLFVWAQNDCIKVPPLEPSDDEKPLFMKPLEKVWAKYPLWDASNTLLMDDTSDKCPTAFQQNTLHPPSLHGRRSHMYSAVSTHHGMFGYGQPLPPILLSPQDEFLSDAENEGRQMQFFHLLVNALFEPDHGASQRNRMLTFLEQHGMGHMGWRGPIITNALTESTTLTAT